MPASECISALAPTKSHPPKMHKAALALSLAATVAAANISLPEIPATPPLSASQILDRRLASFSIEFSYLPTFGGNKTHPNELTREIMNRLVERTGLGPDIRPGGITVDSSIFDPDAPALDLALSPVSVGFAESVKARVDVVPPVSRNLANDLVSCCP